MKRRAVLLSACGILAVALSYEFKHDIEAYLRGHGSPNGMSTLADLIAYNEAHADEVMPLFGQEIFLPTFQSTEADSTRVD